MRAPGRRFERFSGSPGGADHGQIDPGSILASRTVKDLAVGSGLNFISVGHREMKGIPESWELYALAS